jgi:ribonucleoside-diphosphate reductase beta chain
MPILTKQFIDFKKEPLFFGSGRNVSRLDLNLQKKIGKTRDEQKGVIWLPDDFPLEQDVVDFVNLSESLQQVFLANLKLQQLYDSVVARSIQEVFGPVTTNPQLESWWAYHTFTEAIHYQSYAEIIKALPVGEEVFDDIMINPKILKRAEVVADEWNKMVKMNAQMELNRNYNQEQHKIQLLKSLYALNILEAILFQSSFLVTWSFAENKKMIETANVISRIAWDEAMHCITSIYLLHQLKKDNDYTYLFKQIEQEVIEMYNQAYKADIEWIDYVFSFGETLLGMNAQILKQYARHNTNIVMRQLGLSPIVESTDDPCKWAVKYKSPGKIQNATNEKTGVTYLLGIVDTTSKHYKGTNNEQIT